ncbi:hypothetical protein D3C78_851370 [compost metagenome]
MPGVLVLAIGSAADAQCVSVDLHADVAELAPVLPAKATQQLPLRIEVMGDADQRGLRHRHVQLQRVCTQAVQCAVEDQVVDLVHAGLVLELQINLAGIGQADLRVFAQLVQQAKVDAGTDVGVLEFKLAIGTIT